MLNARAIAFYLPQYHPIPENDLWWGKGFTEWTNAAKARPMFRGHYQPHVPADLGFYDLRVPETRLQQADMARAYGIEGFCYYHYWFAGRRVLERPFNEVLASGAPDFPFCLCWANETWSGVWHGVPGKILIEQTYPGEADHRAHFAALLPAFRDPRHIRVDGKPLFIIYKPTGFEDTAGTVQLWRAMAEEAGLAGLHLLGYSTRVGEDMAPFGYDGVIRGPDFKQRRWRSDWRNPVARVKQKINALRRLPNIRQLAELADTQLGEQGRDTLYRSIAHAWDNTPRSGQNGVVYLNPDPELFRKVLMAAVGELSSRPAEQRLVFLKSWNEWAEGNHLEPDLRDGMAYLDVLAEVLQSARGEAVP